MRSRYIDSVASEVVSQQERTTRVRGPTILHGGGGLDNLLDERDVITFQQNATYWIEDMN